MNALKNICIMHRRAVFLDFDGVLFDTVREAYCVSMLASGIARLPDKIDFRSLHFTYFNKYRYLIVSAKDYYYYLKTIEKKINDEQIDFEKHFKQQLRGVDIRADYFERALFNKRDYLKKRHFRYWMSLNAPYRFFWRVKKYLNRKEHRVFIITTKDEKTVSRLLSHYRISMPDARIFGRTSYNKFKSKINVIKYIQKKYGIKASLLVDDSKEHLALCEQIKGVSVMRAGWGYVSPQNRVSNEKEVIGVIKKTLGA